MQITLENTPDVPLVKQLEEQLRNQIQGGILKPGDKLPSMRKLAEQLGVSVIITKQAFNTLTTEGFLYSAPKSGVFVAEALPVRNIALILPSVELEQIPRMVRATRESLPKSFQLVVEAPSSGYDGQIDLMRNISKSHISGIILYTPAERSYAPLIQEALTPDIPCIQSSFELDGLQLDSITEDGFAMGQTAMSYLIQKGHHRIGLINTISDSRTFRDRTAGMDSALKSIGQSFETLPKEICRLNLSTEPAELATARLLEKHPDLTAIIGGNAQITLGIFRALQRSGRSVPDDVSLIAMELDLPVFEYTSPKITAVDKPLEQIYSRAVELLIERIDNPDLPLRSIHFPPELKERNSVKDIR